MNILADARSRVYQLIVTDTVTLGIMKVRMMLGDKENGRRRK
jgi:hypothetical protein